MRAEQDLLKALDVSQAEEELGEKGVSHKEMAKMLQEKIDQGDNWNLASPSR